MRLKQFMFAFVAMLSFTFSALAQTTVTTEAELKTAMSSDGAEVVLGADIELKEAVVIPKKVAIVLDLNGYSIEGVTTGVNGITLEANASLTINDSKGTGVITAKSYVLNGAGGSKIILNAGKIYRSSWAVYTTGSFTINGGTVECNDGSMAIRVSGSGTITLNGGTVTSVQVTSGTLNVQNDDATITSGILLEKGAKDVNITAGTVNGKVTVAPEAQDNLTVSGGTFEDPDAVKDYLEDGLVIDNGQVVAGMFKIGGTYYLTLAEAAAAAQAGQTIVLLKDTDEAYVLPAGVKLDKNGFNAPNIYEAVAKIGETAYATLAEAVAAAQSGATITLMNGEHELPLFAGKELTFVGESKEGVIVNDAPAAVTQGWNGSTFHFENLTAKGTNANYHGLANGVVAVTYKNCNINGLRFLYATEGVSFENCAFNAQGVEHSFWTYGASKVTVKNSTFTYTDRAVNCYSENGASHEADITFEGCSFTYAGTNDAPAGAVEINSGSVKSIELTMKDCTAPAKGEMWFNSQWDNKKGENTVVSVDDVKVWPLVAKIGDTTYATLDAAIKAAKAGDNTIELLADCAENVTITQVNGTNIVINGKGKTYTGTITVKGDGASNNLYNTETLTFQNINFTPASGKYAIAAVKNTFARNITVDGCTFKGNNDVYGIDVRHGYNYTVKNTTAEGVYTFLNARNALTGLTVENVTVKCANVAFAGAYGFGDASFKDVTIVSDTNGVKVNNPNGSALTFENCSITAKTPVTFIESAGFASALTAEFNGTNNMVVSDGGTYWFNIVEADGVDATFKAIVNDAALDMSNTAFAASVGNVYYSSLQKAIDAAVDNDNVVVARDIELDAADCVTNSDGYSVFVNVAGKAITIDLNGKAITADLSADQFASAKSSLLMAVFSVDTDGNLTLNDGKGTGKVAVTANDASVYSLISNYDKTAKLTINGGSYELDKARATSSLIHSDPSEAVVVNGGNFYLGNVNTGANGSPWIFNVNGNNEGHVTVNGGTFNYDVNHQYWVFEVHVDKTLALKDNGNGTWTVVPAVAYVNEKNGNYTHEVGYATLAEAISAAQAGETVKVFEGTYAVPAMKAGITIEGVGNVLFEGTLSGTLENLTLKNLHIKGGNAQRWAYAKGNLLFENVTFEATSVYALHFDGITEGTNLTYKNCTIIGWAALGGSPASCVFDGCTIKDNGAYGVIRTYFDTTIENCTFDVANANTTDVYEDGIHAVEGANVVVDNCTNVNGEMKDLVNVSGASVVSVDGVEIKNVAQVGETKYTDLQEAIKAAAPAGTVELLADVTVDEWIMFSETLTIGNGDIITTQINGLTINGNGKTVTIKDIESAGNGARLFYDATNLNINGLTFNFVDNAANLGGIGLTAGTIENVTFNGGGYAIFPGTGAVTIDGCTFKTNATSIYYEEARDNLVVTGNTFENPDNVNVILLRGNTTFTDNNVISGRTVNVVSGSPVVTGNNFNDVRFKVYNVATATIENNTINTLAFNDESVVNSTFDSNTLSAEAQAVLDAANFPAVGSNSFAYTKEENGYVRVWGEGGGNAKESYELKLYSGETLIATTKLNNVGNILNGDVYVTWNFYYPESTDEYWTTTWEEGHPNSAAQPTEVELYIDGTLVATTAAKMSGADDIAPVVWRNLGGVAIANLLGEGTETSPYLISNKKELMWLQAKVDELATDGSTQFAGKYFKLTADIDLAGVDWNPIGSMSGDHGSFKGVFDGGDHTISNLKVEQAGNGIGLFARTTGNAVIKNLKLNNVSVKSTDNSNYVGAVVGNAYASTKIENVHVSGNVLVSGRGYIGGIAGHGYVVMDNVSVVATGDGQGNDKGLITSTFWCAGGILGYGGEGSTNIMNANVENVVVTSAAGGLGAIVGMAEDNNGTQPISGSNLSAKDVEIKTYIGAYGDAYANHALGYLYGGNPTSKLTGELSVENVTLATSNGVDPTPADAVAKVNNAIYFSLQEALNAAQAGETVTLIADVALTETLTVAAGKNVVLDLNGKKVESADITVTVFGELAVVDNTENKDGKIISTHATGNEAVAVKDGGKFTLNSGNIEGASYGIYLYTSGGTAIINGGTITIGGEYKDGMTVAVASDKCSLTVTGGTFAANGVNYPIYTWGENTIELKGGMFDFKPNSLYIAERYAAEAVADKDGWFKVVYVEPMITIEGGESFYTLGDAFAAAKENDVIVINGAGEYVWPGTAIPAGVTVKATVEGVVAVSTGDENAINATTLNVENVDFKASFKAAFVGNGKAKNLTFTDCSFTGVYAFHVDAAAAGAELNFNNCVFNGFTTFATTVEKINIEGGNVNGALIVRQDAVIENVVFSEDAAIQLGTSDVVTGKDVAIVDCTVADTDGDGTVPEVLDIFNAADSIDNSNFVVVNGAVISGAVAQVGETKYATLQEALDAAAAGTGNVTVEILADVNLTGIDWNPVRVSGPGYPLVTVEGGNHTITGLNDMLFHSTWAGGSGLIIKDLTIANSAIVNDKEDAAGTVGVGAFIGYPEASATITLENCHLMNSSVEGGHWTGGLIGMAGGYNGNNDGPVFMNLTIKGCSVTGSTITGKGSVGGVIGHGSCSAWTNVVIEETTVSGNTIKSTGSSNVKAGAVMGTIGAAGQPTTADGVTKTGGATVSATVAGNTVTSNGTAITTIYGRQGTDTGMLYVAGGSYDNYPIEQGVAYAAPIEGYVIVENAGTYGLVVDPAYGKAAKIGDTYYATLQAAFDAVKDGETITLIDNVTVSEATAAYNDGTYIDGVRYTGDKSFTVDFNGKTVTDDGCVNDYLIYINNKGEKASEITFTNGTIVSANGCWSAVCVNSSAATQNVELNLNGMNITNSNDAVYSGNPVVRVRNLATVNVNGGTTITSNGASYGVAANTDGSTLNINEGATIVQQNSGTTGGNSVFAAVGGKGVINIKGGTITSDRYGVHTMTTGTPVINISGGTITAPVALKSSTNGGNGELATINVTGGTINGTLETYTENGKIVVSGGTFSEAVAQEYCAEGFVPKDNGDGTYGVEEAPKDPEVVDGKIEFVDGEFDMYTNDTDIENVEITYKRTIDSDWNALYVPFAIPASELLDNFDIAYINDVREIDADDDGELDNWQMELIKIKKETAVLRANHPYFVRSKSADYTENNLSLTLTTTLYKATVAEVKCSSMYSIYTIKGLNELRASTEFGDADRVLGYDKGETTWGKMADGYSLKPFRFYLTITNRDGSPVGSSAQMSIVVRDEDGTTGIDGIYGDENGETVIFDLYGRRVLEPEKGNIYIINGKKVMIK